MAAPASVPWRAWEGLDGVLYQFSPGEGGYTLLVTDLSQLWTETLDSGPFLQRLRTLNPALEATADQALPCLTAAVGAADGGASWERGADLLRLDSRRGGVPLRWEFRLRPLPADQLAARLLRPLLAALGQMQAREQRLLTEVAARDRELQDYRQSGAILTLRSLRTEPLDRGKFEAEMAGRGLRPEQLVDASAWRAAPPPPQAAVRESPVKVAPASPAGRAAAPAEPPREDEKEAAERRRRELKQRLDEEARRSEMERKNKKKRLNL